MRASLRTFVILALRRQKPAGPQGPQANQPNLCGKFQASEGLCLSKRKMDGFKVVPPPPRLHAHMLTVRAHTHTRTHKHSNTFIRTGLGVGAKRVL